MQFTCEDFNIMVNELLFRDIPSYDKLCEIAQKELKGKIASWCYSDTRLRGKCCEDDIMQDTCIRLIKYTVNNFLLHENVIGPYNNDPEGFCSWMYTIAKNIKEDTAKKVMDMGKYDIDEPGTEPPPSTPDTENMIEILQDAFTKVLDANISIYKTLTWIAQFVLILRYKIDRIDSTKVILERFGDRPLSEVFGLVFEEAKRIVWLRFTPEQLMKIINALNTTKPDGRTYGETPYREFYMNYRGAPSGEKSVSDWINRVNGYADGSNGKQKTEKKTHTKEIRNSGETPDKPDGTKGENDDESSDS